MSLECLKICMIGDERAGKTTLAKAIMRTWLQYLFSSDENATDTFDISERTAGMNIYKANISSIGHTLVYDFAGQEHFHRTHDMFFDESNSMYIMVFSGLLSRSQMFEQCRRWAAFLTAALRRGAIPVVVVVISRRDACSDLAKVEEISQGVVIELKSMFKAVLNIQERFFILDCRKSQATEMVQFREFLGELKREKLQVHVNERAFLIKLISGMDSPLSLIAVHIHVYVCVCVCRISKNNNNKFLFVRLYGSIPVLFSQ